MENGCNSCSSEKWCRKWKYSLSKSDCPCYGCLVKPVCLNACEPYSKWSIEVEHNIKYERGPYSIK